MPLSSSKFRVVPGVLFVSLALGCQGPQVAGAPGVAGKDAIQLVGQPYALTHKGARSDSKKASDGVSGAGGDISGLLCGSDLMMQVAHKGDHVRVYGFIDNQWNAEMRIQETDGYLTLTGSMANYGYELRLFGDRLVGAVGRCRVDLRQDPQNADRLTQDWNVQGVHRTTSLRGVDALWALPAAEQAVLLPMLVQCLFGQFFSNNLNTSPEVAVGGPGGAQPRGTISWSGSSALSYCGG